MHRAATRRIERKGMAKVWGVEDVASVLDVPVSRVVWHCEQALRLGAGSSFFGCWNEGGAWMVPDRVLRRVSAEWPLQHYSVASVAALAAVSERQVRGRLVVVPAGVPMEQGRMEWQIGARSFFGTQIRVPEGEVRRLMDGRVIAAPGLDGLDCAAGSSRGGRRAA